MNQDAAEGLPQSVFQEITRMIEDDDSLFSPPKVTKVKYSCGCAGKEQKNVWGKPGITGMRCDDCGELFEENAVVLCEEEMQKSSGA